MAEHAVDDQGAEDDHDDDHRDEVKSNAGSSSGSDSDEDHEGEAASKREREIDAEEAEALKRDLGQDLREGKRVKRGEESESQEKEEKQDNSKLTSAQSEQVWQKLMTQAEESKPVEKEKMVLVKRSYRFAGEQVNEEKLLSAYHPDAIAYLASQKKGTAPTPSSTSQTAAAAAPSKANTRSLAPPRKKKSSLAAMSAAVASKPSKINTLEKSKMDWNKFKEQTTDERERDEMEAQTKGGSSGLGSMKGYMERQGFLDRVQGRLEEQQKK